MRLRWRRLIAVKELGRGAERTRTLSEMANGDTCVRGDAGGLDEVWSSHGRGRAQDSEGLGGLLVNSVWDWRVHHNSGTVRLPHDDRRPN